ncbi:MAG TPA: hypothetical protein VFI29_22120 [Hanamia sp.]|nr:hypothetical protein [Hanamia sp.]
MVYCKAFVRWRKVAFAARPIVVMELPVGWCRDSYTKEPRYLNREGIQVCSSEQKKNKRLPTFTERKKKLLQNKIEPTALAGSSLSSTFKLEI